MSDGCLPNTSVHFSDRCDLANLSVFNALNFLNDLNVLNPVFLRLPSAAESAVELDHAVELCAAGAREFDLGVKELLVRNQNF